MTTMVERMARAIAANHGVDPDMLGPGQRHVADIDGIPTIVSDHRGPLWKMWVSDAIAALRAMREPAESMCEAAENAWVSEIWVWQAMIDQAIKEAE